MSPVDPRTPVIVGAGQINRREHGAEPIDLMTRSTLAALADAGAPALAARVDAVRVVWGVWPYRDPGRLVAHRIGAVGARTTMTPVGGNQVYDLVIDTAARIRRGELDAAVICAAETLRTRRRDRAEGHRTEYLPETEGAAPDQVLGKEQPLSTPEEDAVGAGVAVNFYAMAETAIRHRTGETIDAHRTRIARLWAAASEVAASNPDAWIRRAYTAEEIAAVSPSNRPVAAPYPKLMTSNLDVDQAGAVVMCSAAAAEAAGIARDRWVFPWAGVGAHDHWHITNRWAFDESPAMRHAGRRTLELAGVDVDDCALIDLYSCFPAAVQVAQREIGVDPERSFTITGGLTFAAGPLNCYCILPLTRAVHVLRKRPAERAFLTGNGGWFTKHSMLVLSGSPRPGGFATDDVQAAVDALPSRPTPTTPVASATLETYTVTYDRAGEPERATMACLDESGGRHWATSDDGETIAELLAADCCERQVMIDVGTGTLT